jgi:hypothetical protein
MSWVLSVDDLYVRISGDRAATHIVQGLQKLFLGFIGPDTHEVDAEFVVSYDDRIAYDQRFGVEPINLANRDDDVGHGLMSRLLDKTKRRELLLSVKSEYPYMIGFLNGLLIYLSHSKTAECVLFRENNSRSFLVGSLHKILFVFLCLFMAEKNRFFVHGAAIRHGQEGYVFWGPSGAGKTTVAGFSEGKDVLSDEAPILKRVRDNFFCMMSPFHQIEKCDGEKINRNLPVPISKNIFLHKAKQIDIKCRTRQAALSEIISNHVHCFGFMDRAVKKNVFHFMYDLSCQIPAYDLYFTRDNRFWASVAGMKRIS